MPDLRVALECVDSVCESWVGRGSVTPGDADAIRDDIKALLHAAWAGRDDVTLPSGGKMLTPRPLGQSGKRHHCPCGAGPLAPGLNLCDRCWSVEHARWVGSGWHLRERR